MNTEVFGRIWPSLFREVMHGSPDPAARTFVLNQGDAGLLASLQGLTAAAASASHGGPSIAAHVDHIRYGLFLLNRWARGTLPPKEEQDWTGSWRRDVVSDAEWRRLLGELRREADDWLDVLRTPREASDLEVGWLAGSAAHVAYHLGAIRQIDRATRGPTAEDEKRAQSHI